MKKYLMLLMLVSLVAFGQLNLQSFRRQATYVIYDDLDNALMPWRINEVDGMRVFTSLSNLSSGTEELMNNTTDNTFVIGVVSGEFFGGMRASFIVGNHKNEYPGHLSIDPDNDGVDEYDGDGSVEGIIDNYDDLNNDGDIDQRDYYREHATDFYKDNAHSALFMLSLIHISEPTRPY